HLRANARAATGHHGHAAGLNPVTHAHHCGTRHDGPRRLSTLATMTPAPTDRPAPHGPDHVANCSILFPDFSVADAAQAAANAGYREVEFWWPFAGEEPSESEVENFARNVDEAGVRLVAINLWAGDIAAGERGVLHERALS